MLGANKQQHQKVIKEFEAILHQNQAIKCLQDVKDLSANLSAQIDRANYTHQAIGTQFFNMFRSPTLQAYDYLFYMEPDTVPIREGWLDKVYEEVEFVDDFWVKGSIYRGTQCSVLSNICKEVPSHWITVIVSVDALSI
jgi:hypothetical protein